jgi:tyrosinase
MWDTCQAHGPTDDENFFLPWHRMFVYFFERIVRKASDNPEFTLPYWNYSIAGTNHAVIPPEFGVDSSALFVKGRNPGVNAGQPIDKNSPAALSLDALQEPIYSPAGNDEGFCSKLDSGLHGNVHVLVGNRTNMGQVPYAAKDPIFWMHHCNIDRLWTSWNENGGKNPNIQGFTTQKFVFADENGQRVEATVNDFLDTNKLGYQYDHLEPKPQGFQPLAAPPIAAEALGPRTAVAGEASGIALSDKPVSVTLSLTGPEASSNPNFPARVAALAGNKRLYLVLRNLQADSQPGILYGLYINVPENATGAKRAAHFVGTINFFNAMPHEHETSKKFVSFDVTSRVRQLRSANLLNDKPAVTLIPFGSPAGDAKPLIGHLSVVEQ